MLVPVQGPGEKSYPDILFANPDEHPQVMEPARQTQLPIAASPDADGSAQTVNINGKIFPLATAIVALPLQCPLPANTPQPLQPLPQQLLPPRAPMALAGQGIMAVDDDDDDVDVPVPATVPPDVPVGPQLSAYEKQRLAQISINHAKLRTLGLNPLGSAPLAADKGGEKKSKKRKACGADAPDESASTDASSPDQLLDMQERDKLFNQCTVRQQLLCQCHNPPASVPCAVLCAELPTHCLCALCRLLRTVPAGVRRRWYCTCQGATSSSAHW